MDAAELNELMEDYRENLMMQLKKPLASDATIGFLRMIAVENKVAAKSIVHVIESHLMRVSSTSALSQTVSSAPQVPQLAASPCNPCRHVIEQRLATARSSPSVESPLKPGLLQTVFRLAQFPPIEAAVHVCKFCRHEAASACRCPSHVSCLQVDTAIKLPALYLLDSLAQNCPDPYVHHITHHIAKVRGLAPLQRNCFLVLASCPSCAMHFMVPRAPYGATHSQYASGDQATQPPLRQLQGNTCDASAK